MDSYYYIEKALRSLSVDELKRFEIFLHSPYFKKKHTYYKDICELFQFLKNNYFHHYRIINQKIDFDLILKNIYPAKANKSAKFISELKSEFFHYLLDFIKVEVVLGNIFGCYLTLLEDLERRNLTNLFDHIVKTKFVDMFNKTRDVYDEYKTYHLMNEHRKKTLFKFDEVDYIIEHGILLEYYKREKEKILLKMQCEDKEEALKKFTYN